MPGKGTERPDLIVNVTQETQLYNARNEKVWGRSTQSNRSSNNQAPKGHTKYHRKVLSRGPAMPAQVMALRNPCVQRRGES